jgi:N6-L-threonylcarbamoyladenine synthase
MRVLGIETSCDETSAAVVANGRTILSNVIASQADLHAKYGGVVPEVASRKHVERLLPVVQEALDAAGMFYGDIDAIAVTNRPGLLGALLVGVSAAKAMAWALRRPVVGVHHLEGHVYSNFLAAPDLEEALPVLVLIVSGGHTQIVEMVSHGVYRILGRTRDDAAGEAFDKGARLLGLPYPGGPNISRLAETGNPAAVAFPRSWIGDSLEFSFSGVKTSLRTFVAMERTGDSAGALRVQALSELGVIMWRLADYPAAGAALGEALQLRRDLGDPRGIASVLNNLGGLARDQGDADLATTCWNESIDLYRKCRDHSGLAAALNNMGAIRQDQGDLEGAAVHYNESLAEYTQLHDALNVSSVSHNLANLALERADYVAAARMYTTCIEALDALKNRPGVAIAKHNLAETLRRSGDRNGALSLLGESLALRRELGDRGGCVYSVMSIGRVAHELGDVERAALLCGASEAIESISGSVLPMSARSDRTAFMDEMRKDIGDEAFEESWRLGKAMTFDQAVAAAAESAVAAGC